jgi:hypothetical protein
MFQTKKVHHAENTNLFTSKVGKSFADLVQFKSESTQEWATSWRISLCARVYRTSPDKKKGVKQV